MLKLSEQEKLFFKYSMKLDKEDAEALVKEITVNLLEYKRDYINNLIKKINKSLKDISNRYTVEPSLNNVSNEGLSNGLTTIKKQLEKDIEDINLKIIKELKS